MKTTKTTKVLLLTIIAAIISFGTSYAASPAAITAKNIREKFVQAVIQPENLNTLPTSPGEVEILFKVSDEGILDIRKLTFTNEDVANYVKDKITSIPLKDYVMPYNQYYRVKFKFSEI
jgi:hypothetical protein